MLRWQPAPSSPFSSSSSSLFRLLLLVVPACRHCRRRSASTSSSSLFRLHLLPLRIPAPPPRCSVAFVRSPASWIWFGVVSLGGVGCVSGLWSFVVLPAGLRHPSRWYSIGNNNDKIKTYFLRVPNQMLGTRSSSSFRRSRVDAMVYCGWAQQQWAVPWARAICRRRIRTIKKDNYLLLNNIPAVGGWRLVVMMREEKPGGAM